MGSPSNGPDRGAGPGHVDQRARHDQVDLVAFQPPGQPAQRGPVQLRAAQHHDGVRVGLLDRARHVVERPEHLQPAGRSGPVTPRRQADAHHLQPVVALPAQLSGEPHDRQAVSDHDHPARLSPRARADVQPFAQGEAQDHGGDDRGGQAGEDITAGKIQIQRVRGEGRARDQSHPGPQDALVLVGADEQEPSLVRPGHRQPEQQDHRHHRGQEDVRPVVRGDLVAEAQGERGGSGAVRPRAGRRRPADRTYRRSHRWRRDIAA